MREVISINGEFVSREDAKISVMDRGFLFGDSIYEVTVAYDRVPLLLDEHFDRLWFSADSLFMPLQHSREDLRRGIDQGLVKLGDGRVYIRIIITRGEGPIGLDPALGAKQNLVLIFRELPPCPGDWYQEGINLIIADVVRNPKKAIDPNIKSGNYLNNVLAMAQAKAAGAFDALMLNAKGQVTEGTSSNLWMVREGKMITPPLEAGILSGITRATLLKLGKERGLPMEEAHCYPRDLKEADEVFLSSTIKEIVPVVQIDGCSIGTGRPGKLTRQLHEIYKRFSLDYVKKQRN